MTTANSLPGWLIALIVVLGIWEAVWKGIGLWRAGSDRNLLWFVLMFVLNTAGVLEIVYIFAISRPRRARESAGGPPA
jgi:methionyl-tRNA synthetase